MIYQDWTSAVGASFFQVWGQVAGFIPQALGALVVFVVGMIVTGVLGSTVEKGLDALKLDSLLEKTGFNRELKRMGMDLNVSKALGRLTWWFFMIVTVASAANILLGQGTNVLSLIQPALAYIPQVIAAVIILLGAFVVGNFLREAVRTAVLGANLHGAKFLGALAWWSVVLSGLIFAVAQLGIASSFLNTLFQGVIGMLALAGGLAFGLGGKDYAAHLLGKFREQVE
ncbi:MAG: hypothetical protein HYW37_02085 [Candidatus Colwellbacteria bacterium]|nr:hypothetical protein [Candidatus Colwellbacteria bacterium]